MAEITQSLFGITPEAYQQAQNQALQAEALKFASLDPMQQAQMGAYMAGSRIGTGIGGLLGAEDPQLALLRNRQAMLQSVDINDVGSLKLAAQKALESKDYGAAKELSDRAFALAQKNAEIQSKTAEKLPNEVKLAQARADTKAQKGTPEWNKAYSDALIELTSKEDKISYGTEADRLAKAVYGKNFKDLSQTEAKLVDDELERRGLSKARAGKPETQIKMAPDVVGAVNAVDKATEKEVAMLESAGLAKQLINQTATSNNSQTWEAARTTIAKAVGENKLSNEDIRRTGVDPRLVQGALDWVDKKITGVPSQDIQKQLYVLGSVLENNAKARYDAKVSRYRLAAQAAGFPGQPSTYFPTAAERTQQAQPNVVDWSSLK